MKALPLAFEENLGQVGNEYRFVVRRNGVETRFRDRSVEISTPSGPSGVSLVFPGASNSVRLTGEGLGTGRTNYLVGTDANKWLRNIRQFEKVRYSQLFEGIDLVFYGSDADLEHDFIVSPGADPSQISFEIENARNLRLGGDGSLKVQVTSGFLRFKKPVAYQLLGGSRKDVAANFVRRGNRISFRLGEYDRSAPLVIDPVLTFATYLDGTGKDEITAVATDAAGNIYVTGTTSSQDFPITTGAIKTSTGCTSTIYCPTLAFISKLDPTGHTLLFSTYLGGKQGASSYGVAVDGSGNVIVSGVSQSADFPLYGGFLSVGQSTSYPAHFLVSLTNDGSGFNFAGTIGHVGTFNNNGKVAVDSQGNVYLTGQTNDIYFPGTPGVVSTEFLGYPHDNTFVLKVNKTGTLVYSTAIPGTAPQDYTSNNSYIPNGIAVDADGNASIAGDAHIGLPTTPGVIGPAFPPHTGSGAGLSGFVLKLNSTASAILFATYLPGADLVKALAQDSAGNYYLTGATYSSEIATTANAYQTVTAGQNCACTHGYVLKLDSRGEKILSASYLTGNPGPLNDNTGFTGIALDSKSNVVVVGSSSADFPLVLPIQSESSVGTTGFGRGEVVAEMNADLSSLLFATFLHGSSGTKLSGVAIGPNDRPVITGATWSIDFPTTAGAFQQVPPSPSNPYAINPHSVIAEIDLAGAGATACLEQKSVDFGKVMVGTPSTKAVNLANCGNAPLSISSIQSSIADFTVTQNCGAIAPGDKCAISLTFTPSYTSDIFGTVTLLVNSVSSTQTISVQGRGGSPVFYPYSTGDLGDMLVGSNPKEQGFYILNNGDMPMVVTAASATGDFTAGMGTCSTPVEPQKYCSLLLSFLPTAVGTRTGTLTVSDNAPGSPHTISLKGNGVDSYPVPQITAVVARLLNTESTGIVQVLGDFFFPATTLFWNGEQRTTWFGSENTIGAGLNAGDLSKVGEVPVTVLNPTPGGGFSNTYLATVYARMSDIRITHMVVEPRSGLLYATVSPSSKNYADSVIAIDPATMTVVKSIATGGTPNHLAVSDDGSLLYVGLDGARQVAQIALPAGTVNFKVSLPIGSYLIQPLIAHSLIVLPGNPHAWVVVTCDNDYLSCGTGIAVYDDSTARPNVYTRSQLPADSMTFVGSDTTKLFATTLDQSPSTFYQFAIDAAGITLTSELRTYPAPSLGGESLASDGTYIYVANGQVIDPVSQTIVRTLQVPGGYYPPAMAIDPANSRLYSAGLDYNGLKFAAFDRLTGNSLGSITFPEAPMATEAARWGSNGIAVLDAGTVMIFRTSLTGTAPAPMAVPAALDFSSQLVTKSSSSKSVVFTNTGLSELAITSVQATGSDFSVSSNCPPSLASGANCTIAVIFTPKAGGARTGTLTIAHNGEGSPTSVALRGDGSDFSLSAASSSATVNAGASASYSLRIAGTSGFSGTASLSCSGAPTDATCAASPTSVDLSGTTAADISVTVTTKARVVAAGGKNHQGSNYLAFALLSLLSLGVIVGVPANKLTRRTVAGIAVLMIVSAFGACGGGGGSKVQPPPTYVSGTPAGTYSLTVTATVNGVSRTTTLTLTVN